MDLVLRTSAILAITWLVSLAMRRATAATRHALWHAAIVIVLLAPVLGPLAPRFTLPEGPEAAGLEEVKARAVGLLAAANPQTGISNADADLRATATSGRDASTAGSRGPSTPGDSFGLLWVAGSLLMFFWYATGYLVAWVTTRGASDAPAAWQSEVDALATRMGIRTPVKLLVMADQASPLTSGVFTSDILLPATAHDWDAARRRVVLLHELAHVRRKDCRSQSLAQIACVAYWFNPLVWMAAAAMRRCRERACDDEALAQGIAPSTYAAHLLEIARGLQRPVLPSSALAMARPSELEGRLLAVLADGRPRVPSRAGRWTIAAAMLAITVMALGAQTGAAVGGETGVAATRPQWLWGAAEPTAVERHREQQLLDRAEHTVYTATDTDARERALLELAAAGRDEDVHAFASALADSNPQVREKAALGLALLSTPAVIPPLLTALRDEDAQVREKAAAGLALRRDPRIIDPLIGAMSDEDSQVREKAAIALGTSGDARAAAALEAAMRDPDAQVREKAVAGLMLLRTAPGAQDRGQSVRAGIRGVMAAVLAAR